VLTYATVIITCREVSKVRGRKSSLSQKSNLRCAVVGKSLRLGELMCFLPFFLISPWATGIPLKYFHQDILLLPPWCPPRAKRREEKQAGEEPRCLFLSHPLPQGTPRDDARQRELDNLRELLVRPGNGCPSTRRSIGGSFQLPALSFLPGSATPPP